MTEIITEHISNTLSISKKQISATVELLEEGATIPFISRYRKEVTGSLDEMQVADIQTELKRLNELIKRREYILKSIADQDKLTDKLAEKINNCWEMNALEDLYLPFKPKRKTRATAARDKGLEPLATLIMTQENINVNEEAVKYLNVEVLTPEDALAGARDIIAEWVNEDTAARNSLRELYKNTAILNSKVVTKKKEEGQKYLDYFEYSEELKKCPGHRLLAMLRAEQEGILRVSIDVDNDLAVKILDKIFVKNNLKNDSTAEVSSAIEDSFKRLLSPSIETEFFNSSKDKADKEAILVFSENLRQLLLASPLGPKATLAIDPGFRTGCKVVCLDEQGSLINNTTIYPHPPQNQIKESSEAIKKLIKQNKIKAIAIGTGTAGRETESFIKSVLEGSEGIELYMVNESGASIYSASEAAREEFPELDLTVRGAISIGRRLMDPLAELVKIDAKSIGVGQYQHDVDQENLKDSLDQTVSLAVNMVGVNLNTSSRHLLRYVSGIGNKIAEAIIRYRQDNGPFKSRKELMKVKGLGAKVFEQSAGFLRIPGAKNPLDNSAVHPESYKLVDKMAKDISKPVDELIKSDEVRKQIDIKKYINDKVGLPTLEDIMNELKKPGLDPRGKAEVFSFAEFVKDIDDLAVDMRLPGVITNLTKFGAFVNIGIKENGLLHVSQISSSRFIKDPAEILKLDQKVMVRITNIDKERKRIQLTMKD
ncbi:MAG: RNA-binding transcriptional accessory protein [Ignavibacteria bacterium]|nr:RNA-binding transcriptional accessory protein [Ignavibacteria bacterium]